MQKNILMPQIFGILLIISTLGGCDDRVFPFERHQSSKSSDQLALPAYQNYIALDLDALALQPAQKAEVIAVFTATFKKADIPVAVAGDVGGYRLTFTQTRAADTPTIAWQLIDTTLTPYASGYLPPVLIHAPSSKSKPVTFDHVALSSWLAETIVPKLQSNFARQHAENQEVQENQDTVKFACDIALGAIKNAPGDGADALRNALATALEIGTTGANKRFCLADDLKPDQKAALNLSADIALSALENDVSRLSISWEMRDRNKKMIGVMRQNNDVANQILFHQWGIMAYQIAASIQATLMATLKDQKNSTRQNFAPVTLTIY